MTLLLRDKHIPSHSYEIIIEVSEHLFYSAWINIAYRWYMKRYHQIDA